MVGGKRVGAGRKKGVGNKVTAAAKEKALKAGMSPLEYMLQVMRQKIPARAKPEVKFALQAVKMDAAKAAAPYIHPKLSSTVVTGADGTPLIPDQVPDTTEIARKVAFLLRKGVETKKKG